MSELKAISGIENFGGVEFGIFKLKEGVTEKHLLELASGVEDKFLSLEDGFLAHTLLSDGDGVFADVTFATTAEKAKEICGKWLQNEHTLKYIDVIDPESVNMSFWSRIK